MNSTRQTAVMEGDKRMHTNRQTTTGVAAPRTIALVTGVFFVITYITSILALILYGPVLNDPNYIVGAGADTSVLWGAFLEVILVIANIGTAVTLFPILKRQNEGVALGYVTARVVEIDRHRRRHHQPACGRDVAAGRRGSCGRRCRHARHGRQVARRDPWCDLPSRARLLVGIGNGLMLGYLMYRSALVPRAMAMLGLVGWPAALRFVDPACCSGSIEQRLRVGTASWTIPEFIWELSLGIWLIVKGFKPSPIASQSAQPATNELLVGA